MHNYAQSDTKQQRDIIDTFYGPPLSVISDCIRSFIVAEDGHDLLVCDYANIEGRVLAWLAGENWKLKAFRDFDKGLGEDIYKMSASRMGSTDRQIGKVAELALGYQGGVKAFQNMAKTFNIKISDKEADRVKKAWREAHNKTVSFWYELEYAAAAAVLNPGSPQSVVRGVAQIKFRVAGSFLWCCLPSGRTIAYPYPKIESVITPWESRKDALTYMGENSLTRMWERQIAYGGLLAENVTQSVARDLLANALVELDKCEYAVIMHVHDEIVCEIKDDNTNFSLAEMLYIMTEVPGWAEGLPVSAQGYRDKRYRK